MTFSVEFFEEALSLGCPIGGFVGGCSGLTTGAIIVAMRDCEHLGRKAVSSAFCGMGLGLFVAVLYAILAAVFSHSTGKGYAFPEWLDIPLETAAIVVVCILSSLCAVGIVGKARRCGHEAGRSQATPEADTNAGQPPRPPATDQPAG
ncbi:MAG: hypothetical protein ACLQLG_04745 [Thermoguttaceae bacterium]